MSLRLVILTLLSALASAAEPRAFLEKHCYECHDKETKKGGLDLESLGSEKQQLERWIKIHDAVADGEMPPAKKKSQPTAADKATFVAALGAQLTADVAATHPTRTSTPD
jgi:mono/diheme cytochrome c family protein